MRGPTIPLRRWPIAFAVAGMLAVHAPTVRAQAHVTSPKAQLGFNIGDDYKLANYTQFEQYWHKLARESNRMKLVEIGKTAEGRPQLMAIISSPANLAKLARYKEISQKLAHAEGLSEADARARPRGKVRGVDRRRPARHRSARRRATHGDGVSAREPQ